MRDDTLEGVDTRVKAIKSDSDSHSDEKKGRQVFSGKNRGVTPSVAAPGVTHPSDATGTRPHLTSAQIAYIPCVTRGSHSFTHHPHTNDI